MNVPAVAAALLLLATCSAPERERRPPVDIAIQPDPVQTGGTPRPTAAPTDPAATEEPPPPAGAVDADLIAPDGTRLGGVVFGEGRKKGVVLVHASSSDRASWYPFALRLHAEGYAVVVFDLRGHGSSEGAADPAAYPLDVEEAVAFLADTGSERIAVVGDEAGGTASVVSASTLEDDEIHALATVHSGPVFGALDARGPASKVRAETLVLSTGDDDERALARAIPEARFETVTADVVPDRLMSFLSATL